MSNISYLTQVFILSSAAALFADYDNTTQVIQTNNTEPIAKTAKAPDYRYSYPIYQPKQKPNVKILQTTDQKVAEFVSTPHVTEQNKIAHDHDGQQEQKIDKKELEFNLIQINQLLRSEGVKCAYVSTGNKTEAGISFAQVALGFPNINSDEIIISSHFDHTNNKELRINHAQQENSLHYKIIAHKIDDLDLNIVPEMKVFFSTKQCQKLGLLYPVSQLI